MTESWRAIEHEGKGSYGGSVSSGYRGDDIRAVGRERRPEDDYAHDDSPKGRGRDMGKNGKKGMGKAELMMLRQTKGKDKDMLDAMLKGKGKGDFGKGYKGEGDAPSPPLAPPPMSEEEIEMRARLVKDRAARDTAEKERLKWLEKQKLSAKELLLKEEREKEEKMRAQSAVGAKSDDYINMVAGMLTSKKLPDVVVSTTDSRGRSQSVRRAPSALAGSSGASSRAQSEARKKLPVRFSEVAASSDSSETSSSPSPRNDMSAADAGAGGVGSGSKSPADSQASDESDCLFIGKSFPSMAMSSSPATESPKKEAESVSAVQS